MKKRTKQIVFTLLSTAIALAILSGVYAISKLPEYDFVNRINVNGRDFGELYSFEELAGKVKEFDNQFVNAKIKFTSEHGEAELTMLQLGAVTNIESVEAEILNFMSEKNMFEKTLVFLFGDTISHEIYYADYEKAQNAFDGMEIAKNSVDAFYEFSGDELTVHAEEIGYELDLDDMQIKVVEDWYKAKIPTTIALKLDEVLPTHTKEQLEAKLEEAKGIAARTITLRNTMGETWDVNLAEHISWIYPEGESFKIYEDKLLTYLDAEVASVVEQAPQNAKILMAEDGTISFEGSARFGVEIDPAKMKQNFETTLAGTGTTVDVATIQTKPEVIVPEELQMQGIKELVGVGYSSYSGSPMNRQHNIGVGLSKFNGKIIKKGEEFSFTTLMGPVDAAHGWLPELVIKGDETIPEYGGGLCQVSSTMYRAALYSGLDITMRQNHSYAVQYYAFPYGYGLDATVYDPRPDLRWVNDTAGDLLIQSYYEGYDVYFVLYGINDGRSVQMEGPYVYDYTSISEPAIEYTDQLAPGERKLKEYAHRGFKVDWFRTVYYADGTVGERENIHSDYEARPAKYLEGSASAGESI